MSVKRTRVFGTWSTTCSLLPPSSVWWKLQSVELQSVWSIIQESFSPQQLVKGYGISLGGADCQHFSPISALSCWGYIPGDVNKRLGKCSSTPLLRWILYLTHGRPRILEPGQPCPISLISRGHTPGGTSKEEQRLSLLASVLDLKQWLRDFHPGLEAEEQSIQKLCPKELPLFKAKYWKLKLKCTIKNSEYFMLSIKTRVRLYKTTS